jgi:outer membrane protein insertion porin family
MRSNKLAWALLIGLCLLPASIVSAQTTKLQEPTPSSTKRNPFEAVPEPRQDRAPKVSGPTIEAIEFRGAIHMPQSILQVLIESRVGGAYNVETLRRDCQALYNSGRFSDIAWETERGSAGDIVRFVVVERPLIQSIEYQGDDTVTIPEILERFRQRKVRLLVQSLYNENELPRATATVQELVAEKGRQNITVTPLVAPIWPPSTVKITFRVEEKQ